MKSQALRWTGRQLAGCMFVVIAAGSAWASPPIDFNRDIRPILSNACFKCHGFDENERQADLRLDLRTGAIAELDSGSIAIVPGASDESELIARVATDDEDMRMPPAGAAEALSAEQIDLLKRWIDEGAEYQEHWAFLAPVRPEPPTVAREELVQNALDRFVLAKLEQEGLEPAEPTDKITLLRRVTLDLTGLPPTIEEVEDFLADSSDEAYERVVDRLLASPRYGEQQARYWLDQARYGDTHGLHLDNERSMWPYRDWVIEAFNGNMPFDQFTIEQLAGDLLENATQAQKIASGFNRCNVTTGEGGSIDEEVRVRYAVDRTETVSTIWLGLTMGCAVCHDHKFDPVTQKEFYQLYAFFNSAADAPMDGNALVPPPMMKVPSTEHEQRQSELTAQLESQQQAIKDAVAQIEYAEPQGESLAPREPHDYVWIDDELPPGAKPSSDFGGWKFVSQLDRPVYSGQKASFRSAEGLSQHYFLEANPGLTVGEGDRLFAHVFIDPSHPPKAVMLQFHDGSDWGHRAFWGEDVIEFGESGTASRLPMGGLPVRGQWVRLEVEAAKVGFKAGDTIRGWAFTQFDGTVLWDAAGIATRTPQAGQYYESLAAWEAAQRATEAAGLGKELKQAILKDPQLRTPKQRDAIRHHFIEHVYAGSREQLQPMFAQVDALKKQLEELDAAIPQTMVMAEIEKERETFILVRGAYDKPGEKVERGTPAILPPLADDAPRDRLGLARWLVDPAQPLTARVAVNRIWQQYFGTGLVKTSEDFGIQGEWPSHPELLDWLALEFVESGWDVKQMHKLIVLSNAYRQSSRVTPSSFERDPENRLLARGPRFRVDAEVVRDAALFVSGLLVEQLGGKSVKPYQPEGIWEAVGFLSSNTREFKQDEGDALFRRSMYTFWKRTAPPPSLSAFDAPSRETCTVRRARTNTPLQALALLNDVQYVEAARHLAQRALRDVSGTPHDRASYAFRLATSRLPEPDEIDVLLRTYDAQLLEYSADHEAAEALLAVGNSPRDESLPLAEHAAWTIVANMILNLDETITKQ